MDEGHNDRQGFDRRTFLRRAAMTGAAAAWTVPVIQTIAARPAFAQTASAFTCTHSSSPYLDVDGNLVSTGGCMEACHNAAPKATATRSTLGAAGIPGDPCGAICDSACPNECTGTDRQCINGDFCDSSNFFHTQPKNGCNVAEYNGSASVASNYPCSFEGTVVLCAQQGGGCGTTNYCA